MTFTKPKGMLDTYGKDSYYWQIAEAKIRDLCRRFGIEEIKTPIVEHTELFQRGVGETTDIVQKEMYTFTDNGGRSLSLRPEGTAGAARAFVENSLYANAQPTKLFYIAPAFRAEKPQKGRYRQHYQFGVEVFGSYSPAADAEMVSIPYTLLTELGVKNIKLLINSIGCPSCHENYNKTLKGFLGDNLDRLCPTCRERFDKNPLRVLDCKSEGCKALLNDAPSVLDSLDEECTKHFNDFKGYLDGMGIPYTVDPKTVRGFDYYTQTVFEIVSTDLGSQSAVCGGGRYNNLIAECGGPATGATGFGMGMERLIIVLEEQSLLPEYKPSCDIFIGAVGEDAARLAAGIVYRLRKKGVAAESDTLGRSVKAQLKYADKTGARFSAIIGDSEIETGIVKIKNMATGETETAGITEGELQWERR